MFTVSLQQQGRMDRKRTLEAALPLAKRRSLDSGALASSTSISRRRPFLSFISLQERSFEELYLVFPPILPIEFCENEANDQTGEEGGLKEVLSGLKKVQTQVENMKRKGTPTEHMEALANLADDTLEEVNWCVQQLEAMEAETMSGLVMTHGVKTHAPEHLELMMDDLGSVWGLDVFTANNIIFEQRVLTCTMFKMLSDRNLLTTFHIPETTLVRFLMTLEDHYLKEVEYHNHLHAADVAQSCHFLLKSAALANMFSPLEVLAALLACAVHDVGHPGTNNQYHVNTSSNLAIMYNDQSVLENHHLAVAFKLLRLPGCDILAGLSNEQRKTVRKTMIDMVLATDMSKHMGLLSDLKATVETKKRFSTDLLVLEEPKQKTQVLQNLIHCCDVSNPTKPLELYTQWVDRLMMETFNQGDKERQQGLSMSPLCDRHTVNLAKCQVNFINYIVEPIWATMAQLVFPDAEKIMVNMEENKKYYEELQTKRKATN